MIQDQYEAENAQVLGISVDGLAIQETFSQSLGILKYPLLADYWPHGDVSRKYGCFDINAGQAGRGTYIIDPDGILRWKGTNPINEPRDPKEILNKLRQIKQEIGSASNKQS